MAKTKIKQTLLESVAEAGAILRKYFGKVKNVRQKGEASSVVCEADLAAEECILTKIRARFPDANIIAEESGYTRRASEYTWVVDPLDGTSNFVAGIPWFGVQIGVLKGSVPVMAAIYLPTEDTFYLAELGRGVYRNRKRIQVTSETNLKKVLCAFGFDPVADEKLRRKNADLLMRVSGGVRNIRATNSLVDFCYTLEGKLGGCINLKCMIWDIVPVTLMLPEAGGVLTDLQGNEIVFDLSEATFGRSYTVLGGSKALHSKLLNFVKGVTART